MSAQDSHGGVAGITPTDAKAALDAYGLEKMREGMQRAADIRQRIANGQSHAQIARDLSLSVATISRVRNAREDYGR